jgi:hypothetical protein
MHFMVEAAERKSRDYDSLYVHARRKLHEHYESGNVAAVQAGDVPALAPGLYVTLTALHEVARLLPGFVDLNPKPGPDDLKALLTRAGLLDDPAKTLYVATTGRSKRYLRLVLDRARDAWIADGLDTPRTDELLVDPDSDEEAA